MASVLAIGLDPACVDTAEFGGFTPQQVRAFIDAQLERVRAAGYDVVNCLVTGDTAAAMAERALKTRRRDAGAARLSGPSGPLPAEACWPRA